MSFAEIKAELPKLNAAEREALELELKVLRDFDNPEFVAALTKANAEARRGENLISREELYQRLREAGRSV